jgi:hypothetical protein
MELLQWQAKAPLIDGFAEWIQAPTMAEQMARLIGPGHPPAAPNPVPLQQARARAEAALDSVLLPEARGTLRPVAWRDVPEAVLVPSWRHRAAAHERAVVGMTVADAGPAITDPEAVARRIVTPEVAEQIADQLFVTGADTLIHAVAVALLDAGGEFRFQLGEPYVIDVAGTRFEPWVELRAIAGGDAAPPGWVAKCAGAGVASVPLA